MRTIRYHSVEVYIAAKLRYPDIATKLAFRFCGRKRSRMVLWSRVHLGSRFDKVPAGAISGGKSALHTKFTWPFGNPTFLGSSGFQRFVLDFYPKSAGPYNMGGSAMFSRLWITFAIVALQLPAQWLNYQPSGTPLKNGKPSRCSAAARGRWEARSHGRLDARGNNSGRNEAPLRRSGRC
jgi:hypothetical protein